MGKSKVSCKSNSEDIRIYVNDILHVRVPRDKNLKLQSWVEGHTKTYVIKMVIKGHSDQMVYDDKELWTNVLKLLDQHI